MTADNEQMLFNAHKEGKWEVVEFFLQQMSLEDLKKIGGYFLPIFLDIIKQKKMKCQDILVEKKFNIAQMFIFRDLFSEFKDDYSVLDNKFYPLTDNDNLLDWAQKYEINLFIYLMKLPLIKQFETDKLDNLFNNGSKVIIHTLLDLNLFPSDSFNGSLEHIKEYFVKEENVEKLITHDKFELFKKLDIKLPDDRRELIDLSIGYERVEFFKVLWNFCLECDYQKYLRECIVENDNREIIEFLLNLYTGKNELIMNILFNFTNDIYTDMTCFLIDHLETYKDGQEYIKDLNKTQNLLWRNFRLDKKVLDHLYKKGYIPDLELIQDLLGMKDTNIFLLQSLHENGYDMHIEKDVLLRYTRHDLESVRFLVSIGLDPSIFVNCTSAITGADNKEIKEYYESLLPQQKLFFGFKFNDEIHKQFSLNQHEHLNQKYYGYFLPSKIGGYTYGNQDEYYMERVKDISRLLKIAPSFYLF